MLAHLVGHAGKKKVIIFIQPLYKINLKTSHFINKTDCGIYEENR